MSEEGLVAVGPAGCRGGEVARGRRRRAPPRSAGSSPSSTIGWSGAPWSVVLSTLEAEGHGRPPCPFAWLAAGSEGRREQTLKTDQDNGLVYRDPPADLEAAAAAYFERLAAAMGETLDPSRLSAVHGRLHGLESALVPAGARLARILPRLGWRRREPEAVLRASLFFDLRPIGGDEEVGRALWEWVCERAPSRTLFLRYMAKGALERQVPAGLLRRLRRGADRRPQGSARSQGAGESSP